MIDFRQYSNLTKVVIPNNVQLSNTRFDSTFMNMKNLQTVEIPYEKITSMFRTFEKCTNLTSSPVCGPNVTEMRNAYYQCANLTGSPVCGDNVRSMRNAYLGCLNLTGAPAVGYFVSDMAGAYEGCTKLTGAPNFGSSIQYINSAYNRCVNLSGNAYIYATSLTNAAKCFGGRTNPNLISQINIYVRQSSSALNTLLATTAATSLVGAAITWTNAGNYFYNNRYKLNIYPVHNVWAAREANGD